MSLRRKEREKKKESQDGQRLGRVPLDLFLYRGRGSTDKKKRLDYKQDGVTEPAVERIQTYIHSYCTLLSPFPLVTQFCLD